MPDLDTALAHYPHSVVRLESSIKSSLAAFLQQHAIDVVVVPDFWPQSIVQFTSGARRRTRLAA